MDRKITIKELKNFKKQYHKNSTNKIIENVITRVGIDEACFNHETLIENQNLFNVETSLGSVQNQSQSGRCWCFAGTNLIRGNIAGIYDMSGGVYDGIMAVLADQNGNPMSGRNKLYNSGFNGTYGCPTCDNQSELELTTGENFPEEKYYDKYNYISQPSVYFYDRRILGDATGELGPFETGTNDESLSSWYKVQISFINRNSPWASRGNFHSMGTSSGILAGNTHYGSGLVYSQATNVNTTFRIILTPTT